MASPASPGSGSHPSRWTEFRCWSPSWWAGHCWSNRLHGVQGGTPDDPAVRATSLRATNLSATAELQPLSQQPPYQLNVPRAGNARVTFICCRCPAPNTGLCAVDGAVVCADADRRLRQQGAVRRADVRQQRPQRTRLRGAGRPGRLLLRHPVSVVGRDIDRHVFPYVNGGYDPVSEQLFGGAVEYPVLTGMAIYLAAIPSSTDVISWPGRPCCWRSPGC